MFRYLNYPIPIWVYSKILSTLSTLPNSKMLLYWWSCYQKHIYFWKKLYALIQSNQNNQQREDITTTTFPFPQWTIMFSTGQYYLVAASKYQMVSYDKETNAISSTSSYIQDILNEVLLKKKSNINSISGCKKS